MQDKGFGNSDRNACEKCGFPKFHSQDLELCRLARLEHRARVGATVISHKHERREFMSKDGRSLMVHWKD